MARLRGLFTRLTGWALLALLFAWLLAPGLVADLFTIVILLGAAAIAGNILSRTGHNQEQSQQQRSWIEQQAKPQLTPQQVATQAITKAGRRQGNGGIKLLDIGILAYDGGRQPKVNRTETVPAQATHLRPYIVVDLAVMKGAHGRVQFELLDEMGEVRFLSNERYRLQPGENFITTSNWQPMGDDETGGLWSLRVSVGDQSLALHTFNITPDVGSEFRSYMRNDGEIDEWLSKAAKTSSSEDISMDDLLANQEEISVEMFESKQS